MGCRCVAFDGGGEGVRRRRSGVKSLIKRVLWGAGVPDDHLPQVSAAKPVRLRIARVSRRKPPPVAQFSQ